MNNAFTVDVEDYFQVTAFADKVAISSWNERESRVQNNTGALLEMLAERGTRGTFFVLGWVARRHPALVREIARQGHEIASHGMNHQLIYNQSPAEFREETRSAKALLEDICQRPVIGYRAATYSITQRSLWALDILAEEGFLYDSSIFPMHHDRYGIPDANPVPHLMETENGHRLVEFPISVLRYKGVTLPVAGGGYFRIFPYALTRWGLKKLIAQGQEFVFYIHPWEVDPAQPRITGARLLSRFRHYYNLSRCRSRLQSLLGDFTFAPMRTVLQERGLLTQDAGQFRINAQARVAKVA
jgi:polysaccharide deacetylase family protein (PEP-CTERM system associated)